MFIALFATILCGALAFMLFQLRASAQHELAAKALRFTQAAALEKQRQKELKEQQEKKEQQERKERFDVALAHLKGEKELMNKWRDARIALLEPNTSRTFEEEEELAKYQAEAEHNKAMETTGFTSLMIHQLFSPSVTEKHAPVADPSAPQPLPPKLIVWKTPSGRQIVDNMKIYARAAIGTVIPWRQDHDHIRFHHITDYMMVRVNAPHRWIQLSMTYYKTDSCNETIAEYLKTLDEALFVDPEKKSNPKGEWMMWDPVEKTLEIRVVQ
jgi:hypothetical protein